jgi:peptidyl-prolyl cis-trans isomerase C
MLAKSLVAAALGFLALSAPVWAQQPAPDQPAADQPAAQQPPAAQPATAQPAGDDDPVVAIVDGVAIHRSQLEETARGLPEQYRQMPMQVLFGILLDRVIDFQLLANAAERQNLAADPGVQVALAEARTNVLRDALIRRKIEEGTTDAKLHERYDQLKKSDNFAQPEVHARHILLKSKEDAMAVIQQLQAGADFATLAQQRSTGPSAANGGDLGFFRKDQMVPAFAEAAFALQPGQITTEPVQTQFGWHVIKVFERRTAEPSFEDSQQQLRQDLAREIVTTLVADLHEGAKIERFNLDGSPMPAAPAPGAGPAPEAQPVPEAPPAPGAQPEAQPTPEAK